MLFGILWHTSDAECSCRRTLEPFSASLPHLRVHVGWRGKLLKFEEAGNARLTFEMAYHILPLEQFTLMTCLN